MDVAPFEVDLQCLNVKNNHVQEKDKEVRQSLVEFPKQLHTVEEKSCITVVALVSKNEATHKMYPEFTLDAGRSNDLRSDFKLERVNVSSEKEKKTPNTNLNHCSRENRCIITNCKEAGRPSCSSKQ